MNHKLLYFPYISVPQSTWTTHSILYWDSVGAIVPQIYKEKPNRLEKYMKGLVERELVEQVFPDNHLYRATNFDESFLRLTEHKSFHLDERKAAFQRGERFQIHIQKTGYILMKELIRMNIAKRRNWEWCYVEAKTAKLFMMYLASVIGKEGGYTPATNSAENIDLSIQQKGLPLYTQRIRGRFLRDLMPYPINPDLDKLKIFKEKHYDKLKHFRILLEQEVLKIASIKDKELRNATYELKKEEILYRKEVILSELSRSNFGKITFGTLFGLAGASISFAADQKTSALFSLGNAIYSAFQGYDNPELSKDYAYLALIDHKLKSK